MARLKTKSGVTLTPKLIDELASEAEAGYDLSKAKRELATGRPSLSSDRGTSPRIAFRASRKVYEAARRRATREGRSLSDLARDAMAAYLTDNTDTASRRPRSRRRVKAAR